MRPKMSPILQQNNNNNYPCLSGAGPGPGALPHKCSLPLPFSSRPELSLTSLPLIRGLRAWALCSRSRHRAGGPLGQAPLSHPRPTDVHLSAEWGLPLGLDARRAGMGALVTLQSSEGSRTQTQCLFLRTDRGSCLYPTTKPTLQTTPQQPVGMLRGWLKSKTGVAPALPCHSGPNRARDRTGRRWRKPANHTASRERVHFRQHQQDETRVTTHTQSQPRKEPRAETKDLPREETRAETKEETRKETIDLPREETRDQPREEIRDETKDQSRDQPREEHREQTKKETRKDTRDQLREETRDQFREETRDQLKEETRDQFREETGDQFREETGDQLREETRDQLREETGDQFREETGDQLREETQDQLREETRDQFREETRDQLREETGDQFREETGDQFREETGDQLREETRDQLREETRDQFIATTRDCLREETREKTRDQPRDLEVVQKEHLFHMIKPEVGATVRAQIEEIVKELQGCPCKTRKHVSANALDISDGAKACDTDITRCLCGPSHSPGCVLPSSPVGVSSCKANTEEAYPLVIRGGTLGETEQRSPWELCSNLREDRTLDESEKAEPRGHSPDPHKEQPSLDSKREPPLEDQEFGGFMQAPSVSGHVECSSLPWSDGDPAGTCSSWDQSDSPWAVFPLHETEHTVDEGGQWWPLNSVEDRGPKPGASQSPVCVFDSAFPSPPACSTSGPWDSTVPTLTQMLRGRLSPEEGSPDRGLLDAFHDLNKMIVQGYKQASGVSRELLQKSLSLAPPNTGSGVGLSNRRISHGHASSHLGLL